MRIELKAFKPAVQMSQETLAFTANLYIDGKPVGEVWNGGTGGSTFVPPEAVDLVDVEAVHAWMSGNVAWYQPAFKPTSSGEALEVLVSELADRLVEAKRLKTHLRKWVLFRTPEHSRTAYSYYKVKPTPQNVAKVRDLLERDVVEYELGTEAWIPETVAELGPVAA